MKKTIIALISIIALHTSLSAQNNIDSVLAQIEKNNTTLSALQKRAEADKIGNKTGNYLQNPEIEFNYLWGNELIGNRTDFSAIQGFDFPTAYKYKKEISIIKNEQVELEYQKQRKELLLQARLVCYDLVYTNALITELSERLTHAKSIANAYQSKLDKGETNILEYNKSQYNLLKSSKEMESVYIERDALLGELTLLNGGAFIDFNKNEFQTIAIPSDFEQWYELAEQSNPLLNWLKKEIEISEKQVSLSKASSLPKMYAGYMSEYVVGQEYKGFSVGLSIPLWENKNTVKYEKLNAIALESTAIDNKERLYNQLKVLHKKAIALQNSVTDYKLKLQAFNNAELLKKALDNGQVTLIDYILELSIYYESVNNLLKLERDMNKTIAELNQYI